MAKVKNNRKWQVTCPATEDHAFGEGTGEFICPFCKADIKVTAKRAVHSRFSVAEAKAQIEVIRAGISGPDDPQVSLVATNSEKLLARLRNSSVGFIVKMAKQAWLMWRLLVDWRKGKYDAKWAVIATIVAALVYLISPMDLIPDFIPVVGYLDDAAVIAWAIKSLRQELRKYCRHLGEDPTEFWL